MPNVVDLRTSVPHVAQNWLPPANVPSTPLRVGTAVRIVDLPAGAPEPSNFRSLFDQKPSRSRLFVMMPL